MVPHLCGPWFLSFTFSGWVMENWIWNMRGNVKCLSEPNHLEPQNPFAILFSQWISLGVQLWSQHQSYRSDRSALFFEFVPRQIKSVPEQLLISGIFCCLWFSNIMSVYDPSTLQVAKESWILVSWVLFLQYLGWQFVYPNGYENLQIACKTQRSPMLAIPMP